MRLDRPCRSMIAAFVLVAFVAMPAIALAQACGLMSVVASTHAPVQDCHHTAPTTAPSACEAHCNPELALDNAPAALPAPPVATPIVVALPQPVAPRLTVVDVVPASGAPPPLLRFCRLLI